MSDQAPDKSDQGLPLPSWPPPRSRSSSARFPPSPSATPRSGRSDDPSSTPFRPIGSSDRLLSLGRVTSVSGSSGPMQGALTRFMSADPALNIPSRVGSATAELPATDQSAAGETASGDAERTSPDRGGPGKMKRIERVISNLSSLSIDRDSPEPPPRAGSSSFRISGQTPQRELSRSVSRFHHDDDNDYEISPRRNERTPVASASPTRRNPPRIRTREDLEDGATPSSSSSPPDLFNKRSRTTFSREVRPTAPLPYACPDPELRPDPNRLQVRQRSADRPSRGSSPAPRAAASPTPISTRLRSRDRSSEDRLDNPSQSQRARAAEDELGTRRQKGSVEGVQPRHELQAAMDAMDESSPPRPQALRPGLRSTSTSTNARGTGGRSRRRMEQ